MVLEPLDQLLARPHLALERGIRRDDPAHLLLDLRQVFFGEIAASLGRSEIVIEAVIGRGAEGDLRAGKQVLHRFGQHVRIVVPGQLERFVDILAGHQRKLRVAFEGPRDITQFAVHAGGNRRLGETGADRGGDIRRSGSFRHLAHGAIGQADLEQFGHCVVLSSEQCSGE